MSADDFRDLVLEWNYDLEVNLEFQRASPGGFEFGERVGGTGYAPIVMLAPFAWVPNPPKKFIDMLSEGDRERDSVLIWQWSEALDGTPLETLQAINQVGHSLPDRVKDLDRDRVYRVATQFEYTRQAKVNGAICVLIDRDDL